MLRTPCKHAVNPEWTARERELTSSEKSWTASSLRCRPCPTSSAVGCRARVKRTDRSASALRSRSAAAVARSGRVGSEAPSAPCRIQPVMFTHSERSCKEEAQSTHRREAAGVSSSGEHCAYAWSTEACLKVAEAQHKLLI